MVADCRDVLSVKVSPGDVGVEAVAVALAVFSPIRTSITSGKHEVVRETETVVPRLTSPDALPLSVRVVGDLNAAISAMGAFIATIAGLFVPV
jgi:hypothetical protein